MLTYWFMFLVPGALALKERVRNPFPGGVSVPGFRMPLIWWGVLILLTLLVGWRHEVGGDWFNYLLNFENAIDASQTSEWWRDDPGYRLLEWIALQAGWGVYGINLMAGAIFSYGLVVFCRHLPRPWLALAVAVPYLVIILGMGYSRQGIALGCIMVGLVALIDGRVRRFLFWAVLAATFHKSAVLLIPMAALAASRRRLFTLILVAVVAAASYALLLAESVQALNAGYIEAGYQSEGALVRLLMNALPALLILWKRKRFGLTLPQGRLWFWFALSSLALLGLYFVIPSSTAIDRVALYLLPLQLMVFSNLPEALGRRPRAAHGTAARPVNPANGGWVLLVLAYYGAVEFVWLNFATHAFAWLPYRFYPLVWLFS